MWINCVMKGVPEIYTYLDWYTIDNDIVTFHYKQRRDNPAFGRPGEIGPAFWDFECMSMARYSGEGMFDHEQDFWDLKGARKTAIEYAAAAERASATTPESRMLRRYWPEGPDFARTDEPPSPSWLRRNDLPAVTKPSELRAFLGRS